jgi:multisubunit Na+/H+ antiporter MnhE subunit
LMLPFAIASDTVQVLSLPLRRRRLRSGQFGTMDTDAAGPSALAASRRALATLCTTVTPASIAVDVDEDGVMTVHSLPTVGLHMEEGPAER